MVHLIIAVVILTINRKEIGEMNKVVIRIESKNELEQLLNCLGGLKSDSGKYSVYVWDAEKRKNDRYTDTDQNRQGST